MAEPNLREALRELAEDVSTRPLTLVIAPGGSGKTTLLRCWCDVLTGVGRSTAWIDLKPFHEDSALFLADLADVLRSGGDGAGTHRFAGALRRDLVHLDWEDLDSVARRLRAACTELEQPLHIFLDDFHVLDRDAPTRRLLDVMLRTAGIPLVWAIASRGARPDAAARLLADDRVLQVEEEDLSLRADQVARVLSERGVETHNVAPLLLAETGGWATGVQLAARRLARLPPEGREDFVRSLARQPDLFAYVAGEVIADQPPELVELLELAAVLGPVPEEVLIQALPRGREATILAEALDRGLLLHGDGHLGVHALWSDFLLQRLHRRLTVAERHALYERLSSLVEESHPDRAVTLAIEAQRSDRVVSLLLRHGRTWLDRGRHRVVEEYLAALPPEAVEAEPALGYLEARIQCRRDPQAAVPDLERMAALLREVGDSRGELRALHDALIVAMNENLVPASRRLMRRLVSLRRIATEPGARALSRVAFAHLCASRNHVRFALGILRRIRTRGLEPAERAAVVLGLTTILYHVDWDEALAVLEEVLADDPQREHAPSFYVFLAGRALLRGLRGEDVERNLAAIEEAADACRDFRFSGNEIRCAEQLGLLRSRAGDHEGARTAFGRALRQAERIDQQEAEAALRALRARELLLLGQSTQACGEARAAVALFEAQARRAGPFFFRVAIALRVLAECGAAEEASAFVATHRSRLQPPHAPISQHATQLLLARVAECAGDPEGARRLRSAAASESPVDLSPDLDGQLLAWAENEGALGSPAATPWRIDSLGGFQVMRDGRPISERAWRGATTRRLFLRLLVARGQPVRREELEVGLWPDHDPERTRNHLRVALSRLRRALGRECGVVTQGDAIALDPSLVRGWDVERFEARLDAAKTGEQGEPPLEALAAALADYRGPFAPSVYDDWAEDLRRVLERRFVDAGCLCSRLALESGRPDAPAAAAAAAARVLAELPAEEEAWALRVRAEIQRGDPGAAQRALRDAEAALERELGIPPGPELRGLARELAEAAAITTS